MSQRHQRRLFAFLCGLVLVAAAGGWPVGAQTPAKRPVPYDAYDYWRSIAGTQLSTDGQWLAYALTAQGADGELVVRNLQTGQESRHARGTSPAFTPDNRFLMFTIVPPRTDGEEEDEGQGGETPLAAQGRAGRGGQNQNNQPRNSLGVMTLASGSVETIERVGSYRVPEESSTWLAYYRGTGGAGGRGGRAGGRGGRGGAAPPAAAGPGRQGGAQPAGQAGQTGAERRKDPGSDLVVRNLTSGQEFTIPEVTEYTWDKTGTWLAYATSSAEAAKDGAFARRMSDGVVRTLLSGRGHYKSLAFDEAGRQLAFLSDQAEYEKEVAPYRLYYWRNSDEAAGELVSASTRGMPQGMVVSDSVGPRFSEDGNRLVVNTAPAPKPPTPNAPRPVSVDVWSYNDPMLQPMQRVRAEQDRNRSYAAVVHLSDKRFVPLAAPDLPTVSIGDDPNRATGTSDVPYRKEVSWDQSYNDVYLVDLKTGQRTKILEQFPGSASMSPGGKYLIYFDEREADWFTYRISDGQRVNLTERLGVNVWREDHDTPDLPGPYGTGGWTADDRSVLVYDKYDIWEIRPDGRNARMITGGRGREAGLVFRYTTLDPDEEAVPTDKPLLLSTTDDRTKADGFYRVAYAEGSVPEKVMMVDKAVGNPTKAKHADVVVFTMSRFDEFPDLWVSNTSFASPAKVSNGNPQQAEFVWGTAELIDYVNADGKKLRAILHKPENFDPSKQYPMMVYIYEGLTQGLHSYRAPNVGTSVNITRYVSHGYVVLQPDIVYDTGYPGESAEKCVIPAVNTVVAMGFVDPKRIGIQGHSWGGYQITHLITRTNLFAAVEAGASVVNMTSAYGGIRWGTGMSRAFQYEKTQSRIGAPPWEAPLQFIENSPIFWVEKIQTPYLTIHNDADDAVPWYQGIEFISAMRRLGKPAWMFTYNGELHGLRQRNNQKHWTVHMDEFFDHYLLGKPRPEWMEKGVPYLERGTRDVLPMFKKPVDPAPGGNGR